MSEQRRRVNGQYDFGPRCYGCKKPAGVNYCSHHLTDSLGHDGVNWADTALVLCGECADATVDMKIVAEFEAYREGKLKEVGK